MQRFWEAVRATWWVAVLAIAASIMVAGSAVIAKENALRPTGVWKGTYVCGDGLTGATFTFDNSNRGRSQRARLSIYAVEGGPRVSEGVVQYFVRIGKTTGEISLSPDQHIKEPANFLFVSFKFPKLLGTESKLEGKARGRGCKTISLVRVDGKFAANAKKVKTASQPLWGKSYKSFDMLGEWAGVAICRRKIQKVKVKILTKTNGVYAASFQAFNNFSFVLKPTGSNSFVINSPSRSIGKKAELRLNAGVPPLMTFRVQGGCSRVFVVKHVPVSSLGGIYGSVKNQRDFCEKVVNGWLGHGDRLASDVKKLKEEFYPHLKAYDGPTAIAQSLFAGKVFVDYFGVQATQLLKNDFERLEQQVKSCVLSEPVENRYGPVAGTQIFTKRSISFAKSKFIRKSQFDGRNLKRTKGFAIFNTKRKSFGQLARASELLKGWEIAKTSSQPIIALERFLTQKATSLGKASPSDVLAQLAIIRKELKTLRIDRNKKRNAERMARNKKLLQSINIPFGRINSRYSGMLRALASGKPVQLDDSSRLFFGGMAATFYGKCNVRVAARDLPTFLLFLKSVGDRSVFGSDFSNPDFRRTLSNLAGGNAIFQAGVQSARIIGCSPPTANNLVVLVIDAVKSNNEDEEGRDPIFIRSCAPALSHAKCLCVAKLGAAVFPNINQRRYSSGLVGRIIRGNPAVGLQIWGLCGVQRY